MQKEKQVKVPESFVTGVEVLLLMLKEPDPEMYPEGVFNAVCGNLEREISRKNAAKERREAFTAYKTAAPDTEDREQRRREYLETVGIYGTGLSDREYPEEEPPEGYYAPRGRI